MDISTYERRVLRGMKLLDDKIPDWRSRINLDALDMRSTTRCLLVQLYDSYENGLNVLGFALDERKAVHFGFAVRHDRWWEYFGRPFANFMYERRCRALTALWHAHVADWQQSHPDMVPAASPA